MLLAWCLNGCVSAPPPPPVPVAVQAAEQSLEEAARHSRNGNWNAAAAQWQKAVDQYGLLNDQPKEAVARHNLAQALRHLRQYSDAQRQFERAADLDAKLGLKSEWWRNQIGLIQLCRAQNNREDLQRRFEELRPRLEEINDPATQALFLNELGVWETFRGDNPAAAASLQRAYGLFVRNGNVLGQATVLANQARLSEQQGQDQAALQSWRAALKQFQDAGDPCGIAAALAGQGRVLSRNQSDLPEAEDLLLRAARNFHLLGQTDELAATLDQLAKTLGMEGKSSEMDALRKRFSLP
jgi:tetratricopeptide (TPR) repeat protein